MMASQYEASATIRVMIAFQAIQSYPSFKKSYELQALQNKNPCESLHLIHNPAL